MMRPFTCLCVVLAAGSGLYLYQVKHRTLMLDQQIAGVLKQADAARARTLVLRTDYAQLSRPERLSTLSGRLLALKPMAIGQYVQPGELDQHLPPIEDMSRPPAEPGPAGVTDADADASGVAVADARDPGAAAAPAPLAAPDPSHASVQPIPSDQPPALPSEPPPDSPSDLPSGKPRRGGAPVPAVARRAAPAPAAVGVASHSRPAGTAAHPAPMLLAAVTSVPPGHEAPLHGLAHPLAPTLAHPLGTTDRGDSSGAHAPARAVVLRAQSSGASGSMLGQSAQASAMAAPVPVAN